MGKVFIITGASRGLGAFIFNHYKTKGFEIYGTYNSSKIVLDDKCFSKVNVASDDEVLTWIKSLPLDGKSIVLINCAGISYNAFAHKCDTEKWSEVIDVNLKGTFYTINAVLPLMRNVLYGRIINFSSVVAQKGAIGTSSYAASKAALWGLAKTISLENASKGISINSLNLGYMEAGMIEQIPQGMLDDIIAQIPMKRLGDLNSIISSIDYLINNEYITGSSIDLSGGLI